MSALAKAEGRFSEAAIDDEIVVMSLDTGDFFSLTGTARDVWESIDGVRDGAAIVAVMATRYGAEPDAIRGEVDAFVAQLAEAGLIASS